MNTEAYADIDKDYVLEFLNIDFGHLWWLISYVVWKRRYKMWRKAFKTYEGLEYKELRLFLAAVCIFVLCIFATIHVTLNYLFVIKNRRENNYLNYFTYKRIKEMKFKCCVNSPKPF